ncbi:nuclear transport factor 2 family protein [Streptomyces albogriseolus]|uniref:nuclear transport factor 2 family protein n=1 Tax=Streptomyces albogriseolus TaxID=1887 RepID=UPI00346070F8
MALDFSPVIGLPPMTVPLDESVQALDRAFAPPFSTTHHAITGHVIEIDGDRATIHAHIRTEHWVPEELAGSDLPVPAALLPHGVRRSLRSRFCPADH